ncbi:hypothetical protein N2152v2_000290 [Parachlorella kessleri]
MRAGYLALSWFWNSCEDLEQRESMGSPAVHHRLVNAGCKRWVAAAAPVGQPGSSREGEGSGPAGSGSSFLSSSSSSSSSSDEDAVAEVLASAGLDPAELQRQAPDAYCELTLALAQVLVEVLADRAASGKVTRLPAAELMARICFLAWEVGLTAAEIRDGHCRDWTFLWFTLDRARRLHSWLCLQQLSADQLRLASRQAKNLWAFDVAELERGKEHVQQRLAVTDSQWCKAFITNSQSVRAASPEKLDGAIAWLEADPLGLSRQDMAKLWLFQPGLFAVSSDVLQHRLGQLVSRFSLSKGDMRRVVCSSPILLASRDSDTLLSSLDSLLATEPCLRASIPGLLCSGGFCVLGLSTESLLSKINFLRDYGFDDEQLSKVLSRHYMVLTSNLEGKVKPTLAALQSVLGSQEGVVAAVARAPGILVSALDTIAGNVEAMQELGLSSEDINESVGRQPQLFAHDYKKEGFQDKLRYFEEVLGRSPRHVLLEQPSTLMSALKKVDYRVSFMEHKGDTHHEATLTWIMRSNKSFCEKFGYSLAEYEGWREQWVRSERARQYGLDKDEEPGIVRAQQARERRRKARVAARREEVLEAGNEMS